MAPADPLALIGIGALCAIGTTPAEILTAAHGGCRRFQLDRRYPQRRDGAPIPLARLALLDDSLATWERIAALGAASAAQAMQVLSSRVEPDDLPRLRIPVLVSLPPERPGLSNDIVGVAAAAIIDSVAQADRTLSGYVQQGHDGFLQLLQTAQTLLREGKADCCLVGGADSAVDLDYLHWLEGLDRLKSPQQAFGLMPGEGAAFCAVTLASRVRDAAAETRVLAISTGQEPSPWYTGEATIGRGLTQAIAACLPEPFTADVCYCDLNGETWRSSEWDFAYLRNGSAIADPLDLRHPSDAWGDLGAASAAMLTAFAKAEFDEGADAGRTALVCASSDTRPTRSACLLAAPTT
jgi:3-oxoacyl-[acyl-carrier-protein] synthase I